jgi:hypothetical protein
MARKPPDYADWKGHEDLVEEAFEQAGANIDPQPQHFGGRPDLALCDAHGRRLCFIEVKGYVKSEYNDVAQATRHLDVAQQSAWGELHYSTPRPTPTASRRS